MKCTARRGEDDFLLVDGERGIIANTNDLVRSKPMPLESILRRGYWESYECGSDVVDALMSLPEGEPATDIPILNKYNPNQPRDSRGRFGSGGGGGGGGGAAKAPEDVVEVSGAARPQWNRHLDSYETKELHTIWKERTDLNKKIKNNTATDEERARHANVDGRVNELRGLAKERMNRGDDPFSEPKSKVTEKKKTTKKKTETTEEKKKKAEDAKKKAEEAQKKAEEAKKAAKDAEKKSEDAKKAAEDAKKAAEEAEKAAEVAKKAAEEAKKAVEDETAKKTKKTKKEKEAEKKEWKDTASVSSTEDQLQGLGIGLTTTYDDQASTTKMISRGNRAGAETVRMHNDFTGPAMQHTQGKEFTLEIHGGSSYGSGDRRLIGTWRQGGWTREMEMAGGLRVQKEAKMRLNSWSHNVNTDFDTVYRHEYGHNVWHNGLSSQGKADFRSMAKAEGLGSQPSGFKGGNNKWTKNQKKHPVSQYAGYNVGELWSESFAAYTSTQYRRGSLPPKVESFLDNSVGGAK